MPSSCRTTSTRPSVWAAGARSSDARDSREMGWGLANVIALSDHLIVNDGSLEKFREEASAYLRSIA